MQNPQKDNVTQRPPIQPSEDGIISLLDAPELDEGVVAEATFYGADGIAELLAAVEPKSKLHPERKAAALFLLGG